MTRSTGLKRALAAGPVLADDLLRDARRNGIASKTLCRAKRPAGAEPDKPGYEARWYWRTAGDTRPPVRGRVPESDSSSDGHLPANSEHVTILRRRRKAAVLYGGPQGTRKGRLRRWPIACPSSRPSTRRWPASRSGECRQDAGLCRRWKKSAAQQRALFDMTEAGTCRLGGAPDEPCPDGWPHHASRNPGPLALSNLPTDPRPDHSQSDHRRRGPSLRALILRCEWCGAEWSRLDVVAERPCPWRQRHCPGPAGIRRDAGRPSRDRERGPRLMPVVPSTAPGAPASETRRKRARFRAWRRTGRESQRKRSVPSPLANPGFVTGSRPPGSRGFCAPSGRNNRSCPTTTRHTRHGSVLSLPCHAMMGTRPGR